jgi:hypothetical protein
LHNFQNIACAELLEFKVATFDCILFRLGLYLNIPNANAEHIDELRATLKSSFGGITAVRAAAH